MLIMGVFGCCPTLEILPSLKVAVPLTAYTKNLETLREMSSGLLEERVRMKLKLVNPLLWEILVARRSLLASARGIARAVAYLRKKEKITWIMDFSFIEVHIGM